MNLRRIDTESKLYVIGDGTGWSCYGFDVLDRKARNVAMWCNVLPPSADLGTNEHFEQCRWILDRGAEYATKTGKRCNAELIPEFIGLEGKRVEVTMPEGHSYRFWIGKSTGWMPCHIERKISRSRGGGAAYFPAGATVRIVRGK